MNTKNIPIPKKYITDFEKMGFGMFVHWGLYSQMDKGSWGVKILGCDMNEYKKYKDTFTAEDFDAEELVLTAKNAGCKYITLTTRHHEGFSLYDTCGLSDYDAPHSPAGRDLVKEFVDACNKHDIVPFLYHTTLDWYNDDYTKDFDEYLKYLQKSIEILCTRYGKIGGFWFDGNWDKPDADWKEDELYGIIRKYQPEAIIINNTGLWNRGETGHPEIDAVTFEQGTPFPMNREGMTKYIAAETCHVMNGHWGFASTDLNYKPIKYLIESLCDSRKVGSNYLLNVGPTAQGGIAIIQKEYMRLIGEWMKIYGESIYEGKPYAIQKGKNFILKGEDCLYLFFYDLPVKGNEHVTVNENVRDENSFIGVTDKLKSVFWMDNNEELAFEQREDNLYVDATGYSFGTNYCVRVAKAIVL